MALTPMMARWQEVKAAHADCIVFYRLGDFYEMFFEDAEIASAALGLVLTGRDCGMATRAPMCGVPYHAAATYIKKLVERGHKVAICEQLTAPQKGKTLVERGVVKIITPGTYDDDNFLEQSKNNFVASVYTSGKDASVAWCDITTGEFYVIAIPSANTDDILAMIQPREVIDSNGHYGYSFNSATAYTAILRYFKITNTEIFDLKAGDKTINSAGALLEYIQLTQKMQLANVTAIRVLRDEEFMTIDKTARENLELNTPYRDVATKRGSLLWVIDETKTPMGSREIVAWLNRPLQNFAAINRRFDAVDAFVNDSVTLKDLRASLEKIGDISRLCGKVAKKHIMPREFGAISRSLNRLGEVKKSIRDIETEIIKECNENIILIPELADLIARAIADEPPIKLDAGGYIRAGFSPELDDLREAGTKGRTWLGELEKKERTETGLKELKIGYNRIAGYYFEIPLRLSDQVPYRFTRRSTTANAERYITQELKDLEEKIIGADRRAIELESKLLGEIREAVMEHLPQLIKNAENVAIIDVLQSFAYVAITNNYVRPTINEKGVINLKDARHPVVEKLIGANNYIANDCDLRNNTMLITGPNMAGKSTYMRMIAHVTILAHIGCFVPATIADIALTDRIFTRIGASDSMLTGESTFMVEMNEVSNITHNATKNSLVLLDEVGRGTGTSDGLALASSIITYITDKIGANTMFATHFHELTNLNGTNPKIQNYKVLTEQIDNEIVFLHKLEQGIETNSFGIDVAKMAGLPKEIIDGARKLLT